MNFRKFTWIALSLAVMAGFVAGPAMAQEWVGTDEFWGTGTNWNPAVVPNDPAAVADFAGNGVVDVNVNGTYVLDMLRFTGAGYTLGGAGDLTLTQLQHSAVGVNTVSAKLSSAALVGSVTNGTLALTNTSNTITGGTMTVGTGGVLEVVGDADGLAVGSGTKMVLDGGTLALKGGGLPEGLHAFWQMNQVSGGMVSDASGNGHDLVAYNNLATVVDATRGNVIYVNKNEANGGSYMQVQAGDTLMQDMEQSYAISYWANLQSGYKYPRQWSNKDGSYNNDKGWSLESENDDKFKIWAGRNGDVDYTSTNYYGIGTWHHVVAELVKRGDGKHDIRLYIDGVQRDQKTVNDGDIDNTPALFTIGRQAYSLGDQADFLVDEFAIWQHGVLGADQASREAWVQNIMNNGVGTPFDGLFLYDVDVNASSTITVTGDSYLSNLAVLNPALVLTITGGKLVDFTTATLNGDLTVDTDGTVDLGYIDDQGIAAIVTKLGTGTLVMSDVNSNVLATNFNVVNGTLAAAAVGANTSLAGSAVTLGGGNLALTGSAAPVFAPVLTVTASGKIIVEVDALETLTLNSSPTIAAGATLTYEVIAGSLVQTGVISGDGNVATNGSVTFTSANTYLGTTDIIEGTLAITDPNALGAGIVNVQAGGVLDVQAADAALGSVQVGIPAIETEPGVWTPAVPGGTLRLSADQVLGTAPTAPIVGTYEINADITDFGLVTLADGTTMNAVNAARSYGGDLQLDGNVLIGASDQQLTLGGSVSGVGGITKVGAADLFLGIGLGTASFTYQGATNVQGGNLFVLDPVNGTASVTVSGGNLSVDAALTTADGGFVSVVGGNLFVNAQLTATNGLVSVAGGNITATAGITANAITLDGGTFTADAAGAINADLTVNGGEVYLNVGGAMAGGKTLYLNDGGTLVVNADGALAGVSMVNSGVYYIRFDAEQSAGNFPTLNVDPGAALGGDMDNAVYGAGGVTFSGGAVFAPNLAVMSMPYNLPTTDALSGQIYVGLTDLTASYTLGDDGDAGTTDDIYGLGAALGPWTQGTVFTGTIAQYVNAGAGTAAAGDMLVKMQGYDLALGDGVTAATLNINDPADEVVFQGEGLLTINGWTGTAAMVNRQGIAVGNDIGKVLQIAGTGSVAVGQTVTVSEGIWDIGAADAVAGSVIAGPGSVFWQSNDPSTGTFTFQNGSMFRMNDWTGDLTAGATWNIGTGTGIVVDKEGINLAETLNSYQAGLASRVDYILKSGMNDFDKSPTTGGGIVLGDGRMLAPVWGQDGKTDSLNIDPTATRVILAAGPGKKLEIQDNVDGVDFQGAVLQAGRKDWWLPNNDGTNLYVGDLDGNVELDNYKTYTNIGAVEVVSGWLLIDTAAYDAVKDSAYVLLDGGRTQINYYNSTSDAFTLTPEIVVTGESSAYALNNENLIIRDAHTSNDTDLYATVRIQDNAVVSVDEQENYITLNVALDGDGTLADHDGGNDIDLGSVWSYDGNAHVLNWGIDRPLADDATVAADLGIAIEDVNDDRREDWIGLPYGLTYAQIDRDLRGAINGHVGANVTVRANSGQLYINDSTTIDADGVVSSTRWGYLEVQAGRTGNGWTTDGTILVEDGGYVKFRVNEDDVANIVNNIGTTVYVADGATVRLDTDRWNNEDKAGRIVLQNLVLGNGSWTNLDENNGATLEVWAHLEGAATIKDVDNSTNIGRVYLDGDFADLTIIADTTSHDIELLQGGEFTQLQAYGDNWVDLNNANPNFFGFLIVNGDANDIDGDGNTNEGGVRLYHQQAFGNGQAYLYGGSLELHAEDMDLSNLAIFGGNLQIFARQDAAPNATYPINGNVVLRDMMVVGPDFDAQFGIGQITMGSWPYNQFAEAFYEGDVDILSELAISANRNAENGSLNTLYMVGQINGGGTLRKVGEGIVELSTATSVANPYLGLVQVEDGILRIQDPMALGAMPFITINPGAVLEIGEFAAGIDLSMVSVNYDPADESILRLYADPVAMPFSLAGTLEVGTSISSGHYISMGTTGKFRSLVNGANFGSTLAIETDPVLGAGELVLDGSVSYEISGMITDNYGNGSVRKTGSGRALLSNPFNVINGQAVIEQGVLAFADPGALPFGGIVIATANAALGLEYDGLPTNITVSETVAGNAGVLAIDVAGYSQALDQVALNGLRIGSSTIGSIAAGTAITPYELEDMSNPGSWTSQYLLGGAGGELTINAVLANGVHGPTDVVIGTSGNLAGGKVILNAANTFTGDVIIEGATLGIANPLAVQFANSLVAGTQADAFDGRFQITGVGQTGYGSICLVPGVNIVGPSLVLDGGSVGWTSDVAISSLPGVYGKTFTNGLLPEVQVGVDGNGDPIMAPQSSNILHLGGPDCDGTMTMVMPLSDNGATSVLLVKSGDSTLDMTNADGSLYSGGTAIMGGTVVIDANGQIGSGPVALVGGALRFAGNVQLSNDLYMIGYAQFSTESYIEVDAGFTASLSGIPNMASVSGVGVTRPALGKLGEGTLDMTSSTPYPADVNFGYETNEGTILINQHATVTGAAGVLVFRGGTLHMTSVDYGDPATNMVNGAGNWFGTIYVADDTTTEVRVDGERTILVPEDYNLDGVINDGDKDPVTGEWLQFHYAAAPMVLATRSEGTDIFGTLVKTGDGYLVIGHRSSAGRETRGDGIVDIQEGTVWFGDVDPGDIPGWTVDLQSNKRNIPDEAGFTLIIREGARAVIDTVGHTFQGRLQIVGGVDGATYHANSEFNLGGTGRTDWFGKLIKDGGNTIHVSRSVFAEQDLFGAVLEIRNGSIRLTGGADWLVDSSDPTNRADVINNSLQNYSGSYAGFEVVNGNKNAGALTRGTYEQDVLDPVTGDVIGTETLKYQGATKVYEGASLTVDTVDQYRVSLAGKLIVRTQANGGSDIIIDDLALSPVAGSGLDLNDNDLVADAALTDIVDVRAWVIDGRDGSGGIMSSVAAANDKTLGYGLKDVDSDGTDEVLVKYTHKGDINLDGMVDLSDLALLGAAWGTTSGAVWMGGDLSDDGAVNLSDLALLGASWNAPAITATTTSAFATGVGGGTAAVPEPGTLALLGLGALGLLRRRRR